MKKLCTVLLACTLISLSAFAQKGLIISEMLPNPNGTDSPFEYVELLATQNINFATTPYTIVFANNGTATANGWKEGGAITYAFQINTGSVTAGQVVYVGGSSMLPLSNGGTALRSINTSTTNGDVFGLKGTDILGNGGSNCDGVAVFNVAASAITSSQVPVDAIFFGTGIGSAYKSTTSGYQLPVNDKYNGGKLLTTSYIAPDPGADQLVKATGGVYSTASGTFTTARSWAITSTPTYNTTSITIGSGTVNTAPTLSFNTTASQLVDLASGTVSSVIGDATDPVSVSGLDITVGDESLSTLTFSMTSSQTSVVPNANFTVTGTGTARKFKITPTGVGYTTITLKVTDNGGLSKSISLSLAVSAPFATSTVHDSYHTGISDGSAAIVIDSNYMFVADDETNFIALYNRKVSGLPVYKFDPTSFCGLTDDLEMDIEAAFVSPTNPSRIYWVTSEGNSKKGNIKPDRDRVFATDIVGTGANATLSFVGYYQGLRSKIIAWGDANGYDLSASAAAGEIPKEINGYNIEGAVMGPDGTTAYICFRAPFVPVTSRTKALICPLTNFESWFNNGSVTTNPVFGSPIELNLGTRGFRDIEKNASNQYIIIAGSYDATSNFALYSWNGQAATAPVLLNANLTGLKPEGIAEVPLTLSGTFQLQLISDNGSDIPYNDAIANKDITTLQYRKFVSSYINVSGAARMVSADLIPVNESSNTISLKVYPNPVVSVASFEFGENTPAASTYFIYSSAGLFLKQIEVNAAGNKADLDLSDLESGNYIIQPSGYKDVFKVSKE